MPGLTNTTYNALEVHFPTGHVSTWSLKMSELCQSKWPIHYQCCIQTQKASLMCLIFYMEANSCCFIYSRTKTDRSSHKGKRFIILLCRMFLCPYKPFTRICRFVQLVATQAQCTSTVVCMITNHGNEQRVDAHFLSYRSDEAINADKPSCIKNLISHANVIRKMVLWYCPRKVNMDDIAKISYWSMTCKYHGRLCHFILSGASRLKRQEYSTVLSFNVQYYFRLNLLPSFFHDEVIT